ncbi:transport and Golgi organization protein 1 homolog isoform X2 [Panthera onca]
MILCDRYYKCLCYSSLSQILFQLVPILADHFPLGSRVFGTLWKLAVITATVAICACLIYLWRVVLATEPPVYQVNLQQKNAKINTLQKENPELAEAISMWEEKSEDANGQFEDPELRALRSNKCELEERKKALEDKCNALRSMKAIREAKAKKLKEEVCILDKFYEERKMAIAKNLDMTNCKLVAMKNQMATEEENLKTATKDIHKYQQQIEQRREQLRQAELTFAHQVSVYQRTARDNLIKIQIWEREVAEQTREFARLKHRLDVMEGKRLLERYRRQRPMPGSPEMQNSARREPSAEAGVTPMSHNNKQSTNNTEKDKGSVDPWQPPPLTGRFCTPYSRGHPLIWAHPPPVPGSGPPRTPPPAPLGPIADPDVAPVSNINTDSTNRTAKDKAIMNARGPGPSPGSPCRLSPMDRPSPPVTGYGPPPSPPPAPPRTKFGLRL